MTTPILTIVDIPSNLGAVDLQVRHSSGDSLTLNLPANYAAGDLTLDFAAQTVLDESAGDQSALVSSLDDSLWTPSPLISGPQDLEFEAMGPIVARSAFATESGAITGDSLATGGAWTVVTDSDATDFSAAGGVATRTAVSDTGTGTVFLEGRGITAGTTARTATGARIDFKHSAFGNNAYSGLLLRTADSSNYLGVVAILGTGGATQLTARKFVAGIPTILDEAAASTALTADTFYTLTAAVTTGGAITAKIVERGSSLSLASVAASDSALATSGPLETGKVGIVDFLPGATPASTRTYDNFAAWTPETDYGATATLTYEKGYS